MESFDWKEPNAKQRGKPKQTSQWSFDKSHACYGSYNIWCNRKERSGNWSSVRKFGVIGMNVPAFEMRSCLASCRSSDAQQEQHDKERHDGTVHLSLQSRALRRRQNTIFHQLGLFASVNDGTECTRRISQHTASKYNIFVHDWHLLVAELHRTFENVQSIVGRFTSHVTAQFSNSRRSSKRRSTSGNCFWFYFWFEFVYVFRKKKKWIIY